MSSICGADCGNCPFSSSCAGCKATCGSPFGGSCIAANYIQTNGVEAYHTYKQALLDEVNALLLSIGISPIACLYELCGRYVNLEYPLPGGNTCRFLNDKDIYLGGQIESPDSKLCYGVVAGTDFIIVSEYSSNGANPRLIIYKKR